MKNVAKYSGFIAIVFAAVAIVMMFVCKAVKYDAVLGSDQFVKGTTVLFGKKEETWFGTAEIKLAPAALIGLILLAAAIVLLILNVALTGSKKKKSFSLFELLAAVALIVGGVLVICTKNSFLDANDIASNAKKYYDLTVAYAIAGVLAIVGGVCALAPAVVK